MKKDKFENLLDLLKDYKNEGIIEDYSFEHYEYWENVPYIYYKDKQIFLAYTYYFLNSLNIWTIRDLKTKTKMRHTLDKILNYYDTYTCSDRSLQNIRKEIKINY